MYPMGLHYIGINIVIFAIHILYTILLNRFGRKRVLSCLLVANVIGRILQSFVTNLGVYVAIRFCIGATSHVAYAVAFVLSKISLAIIPL